MPYTVKAAVLDMDLDPYTGIAGGSAADLETLRRYHPDRPGSAEGAGDPACVSAPMTQLRVGYEFDPLSRTMTRPVMLTYDAVIVKVITCPEDIAEARAFCLDLVRMLPTYGPEIVASLATGHLVTVFDASAEGWSHRPEGGWSSHAWLSLLDQAAAALSSEALETVLETSRD